MAPEITAADVEHVARLARLELSADDVTRSVEELGAILAHVAEMSGLDLDGVPPTAHPLPLENVLRDDVVVPSLDRAEVLAAAPAVVDDRFSVPRILELP
jgi:aspartyl-tRNA(Asn)/glutamyl-tRNA(Gln) amidotransferase subunit C